MKWVWLSLFAGSSVTLLIILLRNQLSRVSLRKLIGHWVLAGVVLFALNYFEVTQSIALPINPITLGTTAVLGLPGICLLLGVEYIL